MTHLENTIMILGLIIAGSTFIYCAGIEFIFMIYSLKKKGIYETRNWRYTRVRRI